MGTDPGTAVSVMNTILTSVGSIITSAVGWASTLIDWIVDEGNELALLFVLLPLIYTGVHLLKKLMRV